MTEADLIPRERPLPVVISPATALILVDVQQGFDDPAWGTRNNRGCEANIEALLVEWRARLRPVVFVRHNSEEAGSPLAPGHPGHAFKGVLTGTPDLIVDKSVHSAFYGRPDLDGWLQERGVGSIAIAGITTDHCCETTARMAADLGYTVLFAIDATHTFDRALPGGEVVGADDVVRAVAASLNGEFAQVVQTADLIDASRAAG